MPIPAPANALRLLCVSLAATCVAAQAQPRDPAPLPGDVVRSIVNTARPKAPPPYVTALRGHLNNLVVIAGGEDSESQRMLLAGKRHELAVLRGQVQADLAQTRGGLQNLGLADKVQAHDDYVAKVGERFARLDQALAATGAGGVAQRAQALQHLRSELRTLHGDVAARERMGQGESTPLFKSAAPPPHRPVVPSKAVPMYALQKISGPVLLASLDNAVLAAAPPTPAEAVSCYPGSSNWTVDRRPDLGLNSNGDVITETDAPLTTEIRALAEQLGYSPARIFEYVHNNIKFEPYYGSLKGAVATLYSKAGGPTDQASLLIALLRASNIPARYVRGEVDVSDSFSAPNGGRVAQWVGAKSQNAAVAILNQGLFNPVLVFGFDPLKLGVKFNHVWVEACVPYGRYRGAALDYSGHRWIPLDPSYKDHTYQSGISTANLVNLDTFLSTYMNARSNGPDSLPHEAYAKQLETAVRQANPNNPTLTVQDVPYKGTINPLKLDILPNSLPFEVVNFTNWLGTSSPEIAQLPAAHRYRWFIHGLNNLLPVPVPQISPNPPTGLSLYLPDLALKRVTLSFKGKELADQNALNAWQTNGDINSSPCSTTVNVVPVIMVDGATQTLPAMSSGLTVCSATAINYYALSMNVGLQELNPSGTPIPATATARNDPYGIGEVNFADYANIGAINWHALQAYAFHGSDTLTAQRAAKLLQAVTSNPNPHSSAAAMDATLGEFLHVVGLKYMRYITDASLFIGGLDAGSGQSGNHLGLVSSRMKVQYLFDLPFAVNAGGFLVDVAGGLSRNVNINVGTLDYKAFMLSSYAASAYESYVLQENVHADAVSTVRGLQFAKETGIQIFKFPTQDAWGDCNNSTSNCYKLTHNPTDPSGLDVNYSTAERDNIYQKYISQGYTVTMPRSLVPYSTASPVWRGSVFIAEKDGWPDYVKAAFRIGKYEGAYALTPDSDNNFNTATQSQYNYSPEAPQSIIDSQTVSPGGADTADVWNPAGSKGVPRTSGGDPVNMVSGNMYHVERDLSIKGRGGLPIVFERSYNSQRPADGPLGFGWTHSFNQFLKLYGFENVVVNGVTTSMAKLSWIDGTGREVFFATPNHTSGNIALNTAIPNPAGIFLTFQRLADGTYSIREKNGLTYKFASATGPSGAPGPSTIPVISRLLSITDRNGNALTLNYTTACGNLLCSVTDALGRAITFTYTGGRITQSQDFSGRVFQYGYDANGNLTSFKNPLAVAGTQNPVTYSYYSATDGTNLDHLMKQYTLPRGNGMRFEYYANGRTFRHTVVLTSGSLSPDQVNTFTYNDFRRETVQTNERGHTRHFFFDPYGNPIQIVEENGAVRRYTYDCTDYTPQALGSSTCLRPYNRLSKTDPSNLTTQYAYDANGNVTGITTPRGAAVQFFDFTAYNQPRRVQDANGNWTIQRYDAGGSLTDVIKTVAGYTPGPCTGECAIPVAGSILSWTVNGYDSAGNLTSTKRVRDLAGQIAANTPTGNTGPIVSYTYDANRLNAIGASRSGIQNGDTAATTVNSATLGYDALDRLASGVDEDWYPTQFLPDAVDRISKASDRQGNLRNYQFDANGNPVSEALQLVLGGKPTLVDSRSARYDDADRRIATTDAGGFVTSYRYDAAGNVERITSPDNYLITLRYDEANRVAYAHDAQNHVVATTRDTDGRVRTVTDPNGNAVSHDYWGAERDGRLKKVTYPGITINGTPAFTSGKSLEYDYDANGNVTSVTEVPAGGSGLANRVTATAYDELNRPVRIVGPQYIDSTYGAVCPVTRNTFDALSRLTQVAAGRTPSPCADAANDATAVQMSYAYDDFGRLIKATDALNRFWSYSYDANNNLKTATDPRNQLTTYNWKPLPAVRYLESRVEAGGRTTTYTRNALGQVTRVAHPEVAYDYTYDAAHRLSTLTDGRGAKRLAYAWSPAGRLNSVTDSNERVTRYIYDPVGRLSAIAAPNGDAAFFRFDDGGRLIQKLFSNGVETQYSYYEDNSVKQVLNKYKNGSTAATLSQHDYSYDGAGNRKGHTQWINGATIGYGYTYDALNRLTRVTDGTATQQEDYGYDALGNRVTKSVGQTSPTVTAYRYDAANQLVEMRVGSLTGTPNLTYDNAGNLMSDGARTYTWDSLNQLAQVTSGATTLAYGYDAEGRRIRKVTGGVTTNWLYDGQNIHSEYGALWTAPTAVYTWAGLDRPLTRSLVTGAASYGQTLYYAQDGLGSVVAASNSTDATVSTQRFDAWGNRLAYTGAIPQYGFTGREPDETGLIFYRARYYDPVSGRFTQRDPIGLQAGMNLYAYVGNNPVNFTDPTGLELQAVQLPATGGQLQTFFFDSKIAQNVVNFVNQARVAGYPVTVNLGFRTTDEQRTLYENRASNSNPVAPPGTSLHEAGFAIDINGANLDPVARTGIENIALMNGLSPINKAGNSGIFPGEKGGVVGTFANPRVFDPPHFEANPTSYGYNSKKDAIKENQLDYELLQILYGGDSYTGSSSVSSSNAGNQSLQNVANPQPSSASQCSICPRSK